MPLEETLAQIKARADFLRRVHYCQEAHEDGSYDAERAAFQVSPSQGPGVPFASLRGWAERRVP